MQTGWNPAGLNPLICKILVGTVAAGFLAVLIFHQPWIPVEISHAETGVLVAEPASAPPTLQWNEQESSEDLIPEDQPVTGPLDQFQRKATSTEPPRSPLRKTAEVSFSQPKAQFEIQNPNFAEQIAPLLRKHCLRCHHDGELNFANGKRVVAAAGKIAKVTASRQMPPWKAKVGFGTFQNDSRLSEAEIDLIQNWAKAGASAEDPRTLDLESPGQWTLGQPTVAYQLPQRFEVPASKTGVQWNFVIPTGVDRELFLTGLELRPGNKSLVKRMVLSYDVTGTAKKQDQQTSKPGFASSDTIAIASILVLGEWTPGMPTQPLPRDSAYAIPAGADLVLTVDYASTSEPAFDPWSMGLHLSRSAPRFRLGRIEAVVTQISRGAQRHDRMTGLASYKFPRDVILYSATPELMRQSGVIRAFAKTPLGQVIPLVELDNWDPRWKNRYVFSKPIQLPRDSRLIVETWNTPIDKFSNNVPQGLCVFEVATPNSADLELLLQHNSSAQPES